jgi:hypothetical protein
MFDRRFARCALLVSTFGIATAGFADAIHHAVRTGNVDTVRAVLRKDPAAINRPDESKTTPLLLAVSALRVDLALSSCFCKMERMLTPAVVEARPHCTSRRKGA